MMGYAVIIIDLLNDFMHKNGFFYREGLIDDNIYNKFKLLKHRIITFIKYINKLKNRKGVNLKIIYVKSAYDSILLPANMKNVFKRLGILDKFSLYKHWGSNFIDELDIEFADYILLKSHFSIFSLGHHVVVSKNNLHRLEQMQPSEVKFIYNIVTANGGCWEDLYTLEHLLNFYNIKNLILLGISTHVCIANSLYSAFERNYKIYIPVDGVYSESEDYHKLMLKLWKTFQAEMSDLESVRRFLEYEL